MLVLILLGNSLEGAPKVLMALGTLVAFKH